MTRAAVELCRVLPLLLLLPGACWSYNVVESVTGTLAADEARHYTVEAWSGVLVVALLTEEGDADLYASTVAEKPDFRDLSSCLCGLDLIVIATSKGAGTHEKVYLSVVGHGRHEVSRYRLFIIAPTKNDIAKYQVWDWDPESGQEVLLVNYDPLQIANDHDLNQLLEQLSRDASGGGADAHKGVWSTIEKITEWTLFFSLETLKIVIEIIL